MRTEIDEIHNFKTISPQGDGNAVNGPRLKSRACGFQNHIPARGRKPLREECNILFCIANISKPYPRKGTETCRLSGVVSARIWRNFKTISPQGDGNCSRYNRRRCLRRNFKTISPQGDGNSFNTTLMSWKFDAISKPYPRKGTETYLFCLWTLHECQRISKPYPRKGTETCPRVECLVLQANRISKPYPRKGTETSSFFFLFSTNRFISKPYPRKGTETKWNLQPPLPERGRWHTQCAGGGAMNASCKPS